MNFLVKELNIRFSIDELLYYLQTLETQYQHLKWISNEENLSTVRDYEKHQYGGLYGYSIQSNLDDLTIPCPPYNIHKSSRQDYRDTELMFGFANKLKTLFPYIRQLVIAAHPPGIGVSQHTDSPEYIKIHIPITSNPKSYFIFGDESFVFELGKMYLVNTSMPHSTSNIGETTRIHMLFKIPQHKYSEVLELNCNL